MQHLFRSTNSDAAQHLFRSTNSDAAQHLLSARRLRCNAAAVDGRRKSSSSAPAGCCQHAQAVLQCNKEAEQVQAEMQRATPAGR